jgi:hypothetical protein
MANDSLERLIALVRRELGAASVRVLEAEDEEALADNVLYAKLPDGRRLAVAFAEAPAAKEVLVRRLSMLTATFAHSLELGPRGASRPTLTRSLQDELRALAARARARDAAVIDAHSPVVWGAASAEPESAPPEKIALVDVSSTRLMPPSPPSELDAGEANEATHDATQEAPSFDGARELTERAIDRVRDLPGIDALRKGGHVAHTERGNGPDDVGIFTRSFASIYLLVLVFEGPFDELRAERAVEDALPRVERLVLALPPLDPKPAPIAGVIAMRRGRRR